jgi:hypothetical protein
MFFEPTLIKWSESHRSTGEGPHNASHLRERGAATLTKSTSRSDLCKGLSHSPFVHGPYHRPMRKPISRSGLVLTFAGYSGRVRKIIE